MKTLFLIKYFPLIIRIGTEMIAIAQGISWDGKVTPEERRFILSKVEGYLSEIAGKPVNLGGFND